MKNVLSKASGLGGITQYNFYCPACKEVHGFTSAWKFNGDMIKPTVSPSLRVTGGPDPKYCCHSFITDGKIRFLSDCSHDKKDTIMDLIPFDEKWD